MAATAVSSLEEASVKQWWIALTLSMALITAFTATPARAASGIDIPVSFAQYLGAFTGTLHIERFAVQNGQLVAIGRLTGTMNSRHGLEPVDGPVTLSVFSIQGTCESLHLEVGPFAPGAPSGLRIYVDKAGFDIPAEASPSQAFGNLLCTVARLAGGNANNAALAQLLNRMLALL